MTNKKSYIATILVIIFTFACNLPNNNNSSENKTNIYLTSCGDNGSSEQGWVILDRNNAIQESGKALWTTEASCTGKADLYYRVVVVSSNISGTAASFDPSVTALKQSFVNFQVYTTTSAGEALATTELGINCPKGEWRDVDFNLFVGPSFPKTQYGWFKFASDTNKVYAKNRDLAAYEGSELLEELPSESPTDADIEEYSLSSNSAETWLP
jgi:hypothetical protein